MIAWVQRIFRRTGGQRGRDQDTILHDLRTQTQVFELERFLAQRQSEHEAKIHATLPVFTRH